MIRLFRRRNNAVIIDRLHADIVAASRRPALYLDLAVPDTLDGRFECLTLHAVLALRRLQACEPPGPEMAQHLVDTVFAHFDRSFREMGVGDTSVPKKMKTVVEAFLGRSAAYDAGLCARASDAGDEGLAAALLRNVYSADPGDGAAARAACRLAAYAAATGAILDRTAVKTFIEGSLPWLDAGAFATETAPS